MTSTLLVFSVVFQVIAALFMAFVWAAFLRKLDIFRPEKWRRILIAFVFGCITPLLLLGMFELFPGFNDHPDSFISVMGYYVFKVGFVEEAFKLVGFISLFLVFRKWFDEEINFFVYASLVGLGFATVENILYFFHYGIHLVYIRGLMCAVGHMTGTALVASLLSVGIRKKGVYMILFPLAGYVIASILHGLYDTVLSTGLSLIGYIMAIFIFMMQFEIWAQYSNNLLNQSKHYRNNIAVDRNTLQKFLVAAFIVAGFIQLVGLSVRDGWDIISNNFFSLLIELILTIVLVARITRYTVIPGHWKKVYPRLPFHRTKTPSFMTAYGNKGGGSFAIRGDEFNEYPFTSRINKLTNLVPFKTAKYSDNYIYQCWIVDKVFLGEKKELYYLCELAGQALNIPNAHPRHFLIKPKLEGVKYMQQWPIIGIITISVHAPLNNIPVKELRFLRWSVFKDENKETLKQTWKEMIF